MERTISEANYKFRRSVPAVHLGAMNPPNQAMQRTASRSAFPLAMTSTFYSYSRPLSPAVAYLVSR